MAVSNRAVYATQPRPLRDQIARLLNRADQDVERGRITAVIVPDTNLLEAGDVAAAVYRRLEGQVFDTVIVVAPSHSGAFARINICDVDTYHTALGDLPVNDQIRNELCDEDDDIFVDDRGHFHTEGVDVQLPFLQMVLEEPFDIVPIVMGGESPDFCRELGAAIGEVTYNRRVLVVASAEIVDAKEGALDVFRDHFEHGDVVRLMALLNSEAVKIEGKGPLLVALIAALHRGADRIRLLRLETPTAGLPGFFSAILSRE